MRWRSLPALLLVTCVVLCSTVVESTPAQRENGSGVPQSGVVLAKLSPPVYPPLARQARIIGDVKIQLLIRQDGSVESTEVIDGHPMLKQSALESAQKSEFECRQCSEAVTHYSLVYTFDISGDCRFDAHCRPLDSHPPVVTQLPGKVVIAAQPACTCDPAATIIKFRSAKCLYLWKCGSHEVVDGE